MALRASAARRACQGLFLGGKVLSPAFIVVVAAAAASMAARTRSVQVEIGIVVHL